MPEKDPIMSDRNRILRMLTIQPQDMSRWMCVCQRVHRSTYHVHPNYPALTDMQLMSFVKRLLPEIRTMISNLDDSPGATTT